MAKIIVADAQDRTDGSAAQLLQQIPTDIPIVLVSRVDGFVFNEELLSLDKYILCNYFELGWNYEWNDGGHLFGKYRRHYLPMFLDEEWKKFDEWVKNNPPLLTFQRELHKSDFKDNVYPIEYANLTSKYEPQTKAEYNARPLSCFFYWGRSNEIRVQAHGDIWKGASRHGYSVCDNAFFLSEFVKNESGKKYASFWTPHYCRMDISNILAINGQSKLSLSLPGAGVKCFRSTGESPVNSVMVCLEDDLAWAYEWQHEVNCIKIQPNESIVDGIEKALQREDLYDIYLKGLETADKYRTETYIKKYLINKINEHV